MTGGIHMGWVTPNPDKLKFIDRLAYGDDFVAWRLKSLQPGEVEE